VIACAHASYAARCQGSRLIAGGVCRGTAAQRHRVLQSNPEYHVRSISIVMMWPELIIAPVSAECGSHNAAWTRSGLNVY
jgi:hypothetical protein